jgi:hypothetical protein
MNSLLGVKMDPVRATLTLALNVLRPALPSLVSLTDPAGRLS